MRCCAVLGRGDPGSYWSAARVRGVMVMLPAGHNEILIKYLNCNKLLINIGNISGVEAF